MKVDTQKAAKTCPYCLHDRTPEEFAHSLTGGRDGYLRLETVCGICAVAITRMRKNWDTAARERQPLIVGVLARPRVPFTDHVPRVPLNGTPGAYLTLATDTGDA